eukprot:CAMPEP_0170259410 /NCGR_PEP_ID=MMETSP0116_2-20130129/29576_1 /TAXON_ID=400756 /ORGANISM="Durinskia baltica, Strain CSIRO CS-38" /LENGTH=33 /DNA_ID= /DNA_START= /DNA_END= /DNA_ORIENTATION=
MRRLGNGHAHGTTAARRRLQTLHKQPRCAHCQR